MESVYLAADPDREGEAICFHLQEELNGSKKGPNFFRVMFNEITSSAIKKAFEKPGSVNLHLVDAQQARRILDRLVGYKISPLLWDKVRRGLSAGRVQTVALRLIVEREREIRAFEKREYWTIDVQLNAKKPPVLVARFTKKDDQAFEVADEATAKSLVDQLDGSKYLVHSVTTREKKRNPVAPFITSTLQQEASRKLRFSVKRTMMLAQRLYEGVELGTEGSVGLITYMRTDSTRVSNDALDEVRGLIEERYGAPFRPEAPNVYKSKKDAQDAHEAIRPSSALPHAGGCGAVPPGRRAEALPPDLDALCGVADDAGGVRSDHHRCRVQGQGRRDVHVPRHRQRAEVQRVPGSLRGRQGPEGRGRRGAEESAAAGDRGRRAAVQVHRARTAFHRTAAALQRSDAGEGTGGGRRGAAIHLRVNSCRPSRSAST